MSTTYHYNPKTGKSGRCTASVKDCPLVSQYADGQVAHFDSKKDCDAFGEKVLAAQYEFEMKRTLQKKEQEYQTAKLNYDLSQNHHTLADDVADNDDATEEERECARINSEQEKNPMGILPPELGKDVIKYSRALFLMKKPNDETYDNIAAKTYFNAFLGTVWNKTNLSNIPFDATDMGEPGHWGNIARQVAESSIADSMESEYSTRNDGYEKSGFIRDLQNTRGFLQDRWNKDPHQKDKDIVTAQQVISDCLNRDVIADKPFTTSTKSAVRKSFNDTTSKDFHQLLTYTRESNDYIKKLTVHENNAIAFWTGTGSEFVNECVYSGKDAMAHKEKFDMNGYLKTLNSAIHRSDASEKVVYRGIPYSVAASRTGGVGPGNNDSRDTTAKKFAQLHTVGEELSFKTPQSTTSNPSVSSGFAGSHVIYVIKSKTNAPVGCISSFGTREEEYLIPSDVKYKVTRMSSKKVQKDLYVGEKDTMHFVEMEEI